MLDATLQTVDVSFRTTDVTLQTANVSLQMADVTSQTADVSLQMIDVSLQTTVGNAALSNHGTSSVLTRASGGQEAARQLISDPLGGRRLMCFCALQRVAWAAVATATATRSESGSVSCNVPPGDGG